MLLIATLASVAPIFLGGDDRPSVPPVHTSVPVRFAGTLDLATNRFHPAVSPHATKALSVLIYSNSAGSCTGTYQPLSPGELIIDEGRVPGGGIATSTHALGAIYVGYVTYVVDGIVDIDFDVFDTNELPEPCTTSTPYAGQTPILSFASAPAGFPLPGATSTGVATAWVVEFLLPEPVPFTVGATSANLFHWAIRQNNTAGQGGGMVGGPIIAGNPAIANPGLNTFGAAGGTEPVCGNPVGTGLDTADSYWFEDSTSSSCLSYGGYPTNPYASFYLEMAAATNFGCASAGNIPLDVVMSGSVLDLSVKNQVVNPLDVVSWYLPNALAHACDTGSLVASWLRVHFPGTNPTTGPATVEEPIAGLGNADTLLCATISSSATLGTAFYDIEILDQNHALLCAIDPTLIVGSPSTTYCTAKVNSKGCTPAISTSGVPSVSDCATQVFNLTASNFIGAKNGQWFYSNTGPSSAAFAGGHLCVKAPIKRLPVQTTGGSGASCNGSITTNFNARICGGTDPAWTAGTQVWAQAHHRDIPSTGQIALTGGVTFVIGP